MLHNYFFLKRLVDSLSDQLQGLTLCACFSQNKDELILQFADKRKEFIIRANLDPNVSLIQFPESFARAGRNSIDLFSDLINLKVIEVKAFEYERSFQILFENEEALIFKMHARRSNILHANGDTVLGLFRKSLKQDHDLKPSELNHPIKIDQQTFDEANQDPLTMIPALGKEIKLHIEKNNYDKLESKGKWEFFKDLLKSLEESPYHLIDGKTPRISLLEESSEKTEDPIIAVNWL